MDKNYYSENLQDTQCQCGCLVSRTSCNHTNAAHARTIPSGLKENTSGTEQRASLKDRHELFTPSYKRGNERDIEKETVRERDGDGA